MRPKALIQFARPKPLLAWSVSGAVLGVALAFFTSDGGLLSPFPMLLAALCVIMMQYVAHPMNDIMDYDLDRTAPIGASGRHKPLVDGSMTIKQAKALSIALVAVILVIMSYLIYLEPILMLPAAYGLAALIGYNVSSLRLAYRPFSELYLSMPVNAISVSVVAFIGSGQLTEATVLVSVVFGFAASSFFVSMMSMDFPTDRTLGKRTTIVAMPHLRYCTLYPLIGLTIALASWPFAYTYMGAGLSAMFIAITVLFFSLLALYGSRVDGQRMSYLNGVGEGHEGRSGALRLRQLYLSSIYALSLSAVLVLAGGI